MPGYVYRKGETLTPGLSAAGSDLQRAKPRKPFDPELCGTQKGYQQHTRHGIDRCQPCKTAHSDYEKARTRRHARKETGGTHQEHQTGLLDGREAGRA